MSYKDVFDVFKRERRLNDDETAFLNSLRHMTDGERELLAETLGPPAKAKSARPATKKFKKCDVCGVSKRAAHHRDVDHPDYHVFDEGKRESQPPKSTHALSIADKVQRVKTTPTHDFDPDEGRCMRNHDGNEPCGRSVDDNVHHRQTEAGYHEFETAVPTAATGD